MADDKLTLINGKLRIDKSGGRELVLSPKPGGSEPCCCCPEPMNRCYTFTAQNYNLFIEGTYNVFFKFRFSNGAQLTVPTAAPSTAYTEDGFPACIANNYNVKGVVQAGSGFDDFGEVKGTKFDNHVPCGTGSREKTTYVATNSAPIDLEFVAFPSNPEYFYIPIPAQATSSNCGPPTSFYVFICLTFEKKDTSGGSGSGSGSGY